MESFKMFSITEAELRKRFVFNDVAILEKYFNERRSVILVGGHYNNWEVFAVACKLGISHKCLALYKKLRNDWFDNHMKASRSRFGLNLWSTKEANEMFKAEKDNLTVSIFGMDQSPSNPYRCHWMNFLNQDTGVSVGAEKYARENDFAVVFGRIKKVKRGHYAFESELISDAPKTEPRGKILEDSTRKLEEDIIEQPEYWLWSHRRWKRKKPADYVPYTNY